MKFTIERELLLKPLQAVTGVVEKRQTLPVLSNLLIEVEDGTVRFTGTDLEVEMRTSLPVNDSENGSVTIPARKFSDICRALPDNASVSVSLEDERAIIRSGKSRFVLSTLPSRDFPKIEADSEVTTFDIPENLLASAIDKTHFAMAQQDVRYYLNGMLLELSPNAMTLVATDGHRLALCETEQNIKINENQQVIVPRKGITELLRLLGDSDDPITIELGNNYLRINTGGMAFTSKLIDGRFPDYNNVLPKGTDKLVICDREPLRQSLSRVAILSNEKYRGIRFELSMGQLRVFAHNPEQEEAEEEVAVDYSGSDLEIGFNVSYLLDAVSAGESEQVQVHLSDANSCCLIQGVGEYDSKYVVMPMRL